MVSGGSGVTPLISIIRELIYARENIKFKTPKIQELKRLNHTRFNHPSLRCSIG
ncbi:hypothetical protein MIMGU_mgv11b018802mg, partial [Erythranthe guttata]